MTTTDNISNNTNVISKNDYKETNNNENEEMNKDENEETNKDENEESLGEYFNFKSGVKLFN